MFITAAAATHRKTRMQLLTTFVSFAMYSIVQPANAHLKCSSINF